MEPKDIEREAYRTAKKRVEERLGFFWHLITYVAVNIALVLIWYFGSGKGTHFWPIWPIIGWGVGLFFHFVGVFFEQSLFRKYKDKKSSSICKRNESISSGKADSSQSLRLLC